ncbi:hypothetical protein R5R35_005612 [Gryllus longicercus]|uniref:Uncharacterized protein n=1 Tax=Gryllus longicercus TaxID=2509291 RepID=A0AAN9V0E1_9ORTH
MQRSVDVSQLVLYACEAIVLEWQQMPLISHVVISLGTRRRSCLGAADCMVGEQEFKFDTHAERTFSVYAIYFKNIFKKGWPIEMPKGAV